MERILRLTALAASGATLLWLSGCSGGSDAGSQEPAAKSGIAAEIERRNAAQAAKEAETAKAEQEAEREELAAEEPSLVTDDDFQRGSTAKTGGRVASALGGALAAGEELKLNNVRHQLEIQAQIDGWPESHEAFMKLLDGWGMTLPPLTEPYEYWYNAEDHQIYKRTHARAEADRAAAEEAASEDAEE